MIEHDNVRVHLHPQLRRVDVAGLVVGGGPDVCDVSDAHFRRYLADRTELASRGALSGDHSRCALPTVH
jgi:hypothetical protein